MSTDIWFFVEVSCAFLSVAILLFSLFIVVLFRFFYLLGSILLGHTYLEN